LTFNDIVERFIDAEADASPVVRSRMHGFLTEYRRSSDPARPGPAGIGSPDQASSAGCESAIERPLTPKIYTTVTPGAVAGTHTAVRAIFFGAARGGTDMRLISALIIAQTLAAGCSGADLNDQELNLPDDVQLVQQKELTNYPSGETPSCPLVNGNYELPPPGHVQLQDDAGYCWRIYCATGDPNPWGGSSGGGTGMPNLTNQTMGGFTWNDRIRLISRGPGVKYWWFKAARYYRGDIYHESNWTGWEWTESPVSEFSGISSFACGKNF
jgi:hypothetical protein